MHRRAFTIAAGLALAVTPFATAADEGFKPLFNGKDLTGWVTPEDRSLFTVEDGVILGKTNGSLKKNEFLVTDRPYSDFILKVKVKFRSGNSGIQFRSERKPDGVVSGPQADVANGFWGLFYEERRRGILEQYPKEKAAALIREGDWNDFVITAQGDHVTIAINGTTTTDRVDPKFDKTGIIALQVHTGPVTEVRFKDIEIKNLAD